MKFKSLLFVFTVSLAVFTSCGEEEADPTPETRSFLINRNWRMTAMTAAAGNGQTHDLYNNPKGLRACDKDDLWVFADNNYYEKDEGLLKCDSTATQIYEAGTWQLEGNNLTLRRNSGAEKVYTIEEITPTTLRLQNILAGAGATTTFNLTFSQ